jgi:hypothetical protein
LVIAQEIKCSHCGAPVEFKPGEIVATCKYCGYTTVIETGQAFDFEHSLLLNKYDVQQIEDVVRHWMRKGFLKPPDLARKARISEKSLVYLPFWVVTATAKSVYKGIFERLSPPIVKQGVLEKEYTWLVLARRATEFPTRAYDLPIEGKVPYDFRRIEAFAKVLNSEIGKDEASAIATQQIDQHHRFLITQDVDKIVEFKTDVSIRQVVYLHAPLWFITYEYKGASLKLIIDGAAGAVVKGDIPPYKFSLL